MNDIRKIKGVDSLYGSQTSYREQGCFYNIPEKTIKVMQTISNIIHEKVYLLDKGGTILNNLYESGKLELKYVDRNKNIEVAEFGDFNVYFVDYRISDFNAFINVKEVILPPEKEIQRNDSLRAYLLISKPLFKKDKCISKRKFYILPELNYPKSKFPDFLKFLRKQDKNFPKIDKVFDKNEDVHGIFVYDIPKRNLKSITDIKLFLDSIKNGDYRRGLEFTVDAWDANAMSNQAEEILENGEPQILNSVTQDLVDKFLKEINNRYSVTR